MQRRDHLDRFRPVPARAARKLVADNSVPVGAEMERKWT